MVIRHQSLQRSRSRLAVMVAIVGLLALTACSGDDDPAGRDGGGRTLSTEAQEAQITPLAEFLGWAEGSASTGPSDQQRQQERLVQQLVAECMRAQGFDYTEEDSFPGASAGDSGPWALPPDEFAAQFGYGITTIDAVPAGPEADPNQAIVDGLSPDAREAYTHALYGEAGARPLPGWVEPLPGAVSQEELAAAGEGGGCYQDAQDEVYGPLGAEPEEGLAAAFAELNVELTALEERIDRDERVEAARTEWAGCMADAGHAEYTGPDEPPLMIRDRLRDLTGLDAAPVDGRTAGGTESAELQALRDHERAVAQADLACRGSYDEILTEVRFDLEQEFIADHRDLLERYRALAGVAEGEG